VIKIREDLNHKNHIRSRKDNYDSDASRLWLLGRQTEQIVQLHFTYAHNGNNNPMADCSHPNPSLALPYFMRGIMFYLHLVLPHVEGRRGSQV